MKSFLFLLLAMPIFGNAQTIETIAGNGIAGYMGDGHLAISAELNTPTSVKFDNFGNMYIADWVNNVIRKINTSGIITTVAGNGYGAGIIGEGGYTGDNGQATAAELNGPSDIAFDQHGNMYIDDNANNVIRKVNTFGIITTIAGTGAFGYNGDGIQATAAELNAPVGLVFDNAGNLYFSDEDNSRVRKINSLGIITTIAGTGVPGYSGDGGAAATAQLRRPCWIAISPSGDLYIPDWTDHVVRKVSGLGIISTVAGNGMTSNSGDGLPATSAGIGGCDAIVCDNSDNFFISNVITCSIRKVNSAGIISTICGIDTCGFNGDGNPAVETEINYGVCTAIDAGGNLYFADSHNNRVRRITYNATAVNEVKKSLQNTTIYPNPAHNEITIKATDKIESIEILNLIGQEVASPRPSPGEREVLLSVSFLPSGVYFVKVNGVYAGKFVKE